MSKIVRGRWPRLLLVLAATTALVCAGCSSQPTPPEPTTQAATPESFLNSVESMAALGDSITQGVNACGKVAACPSVSWATGSDQTVNSLAQRIGHITGTAPRVFNDSRAGAKASGLSQQAEQTVKQKPDLVTILIGSNDICRSNLSAMTPVADFSRQISTALDQLSSGLPNAHIFIASLPNLTQLVATTEQFPQAPALWAKGKVCGSLANASADSDHGEKRIAAVSAQIAAYNAELDELCSKVSNCIFDQGAVTAQPFDATAVSTVDYFHPSTAGQQMLAETTWQSLEAGADCVAKSAPASGSTSAAAAAEC